MEVRKNNYDKYKILFNHLSKNLGNDIELDDNNNVREKYKTVRRPNSERIFHRLSAVGIDINIDTTSDTFQDDFLQFYLSADQDITTKFKETGFDLSLPPENVHMISRAHNAFVDINGADFLIEAMEDGNIKFSEGSRILDFGASSGRTVHTMAYAYPEIDWYACDPCIPAVKWAQNSLKNINFFLSRQTPQLDVEKNFFYGVFTKSIWTHLSREASLEWLIELSRIVKQGGFLVLTAHGPHDLARRLIYADPSPKYYRLNDMKELEEYEALKLIVTKLCENHFYFSRYSEVEWQSDISYTADSDTLNWGLTFFTRQWFESFLESTPWKLKNYYIGRTGNRQDIYLLINSK